MVGAGAGVVVTVPAPELLSRFGVIERAGVGTAAGAAEGVGAVFEAFFHRPTANTNPTITPSPTTTTIVTTIKILLLLLRVRETPVLAAIVLSAEGDDGVGRLAASMPSNGSSAKSGLPGAEDERGVEKAAFSGSGDSGICIACGAGDCGVCAPPFGAFPVGRLSGVSSNIVGY